MSQSPPCRPTSHAPPAPLSRRSSPTPPSSASPSALPSPAPSLDERTATNSSSKRCLQSRFSSLLLHRFRPLKHERASGRAHSGCLHLGAERNLPIHSH